MITLRSQRLLPPAPPALRAAAVVGVALFSMAGGALPQTTGAQPPAASTGAPPAEAPAPDPAAALAKEQQRSREELSKLSQAITLSKDKVAELEAEIAGLDKDKATIRTQLVEAEERQKDFQQKLSDDEKKLAALHMREDAIHANLKARRGVFAEVLGALERMGRNPPPALLVTPNDALASVRSAILLGAVVPEMRQETEALVKQLQELADVHKAIAAEKAGMVTTLTKVAAERKRLSLLMGEKKRLQTESRSRLATEHEHAQQLAAKADNLSDLIASLETRITSARQAAQQARESEERRRRQAADALETARRRAAGTLPDKNRIAPAYAFSDLKHKLDLPVAGDPIKRFGDDDGTGHPLQGMMISTEPGALVTAPADGWVVYAGPFRSYGDLLILNVGDGYHVVLAGMSRIDVAQGQFVVAGEPVAEMGHTKLAGAAALAVVSSQPTLYIEFRNGGKPVDPRPWWTGNVSGRVSNGT